MSWNDIHTLSMRRYRNPIRDLESMQVIARQVAAEASTHGILGAPRIHLAAGRGGGWVPSGRTRARSRRRASGSSVGTYSDYPSHPARAVATVETGESVATDYRYFRLKVSPQIKFHPLKPRNFRTKLLREKVSNFRKLRAASQSNFLS